MTTSGGTPGEGSGSHDSPRDESELPAESYVKTPRMPGWMIARPGEALTVERLRLRLAAYVYGNILVLAAIVVATGKTIAAGEAALIVLITTLTTYGAHIIAHDVGQQLGRRRGEHHGHIADEMRDAAPILWSGVVPSAILLAAVFAVVPTQVTQVAAAVWVVGRRALMGYLVERLNPRRPTWRTLSGGFALALASAVVVVLKVLFAH